MSGHGTWRQIFSQKSCAETGKKAGEDTAEDQKRSVSEHAACGGHSESDSQLSHIVGQTAHGACEKDQIFL